MSLELAVHIGFLRAVNSAEKLVVIKIKTPRAEWRNKPRTREYMVEFASRVRAMRGTMTVCKFAASLGVSSSHIKKCETGQIPMCDFRVGSEVLRDLWNELSDAGFPVVRKLVAA